MDRQLLFARHFARLVWLLVHDRTAVDEQKVALRAMMTLAREDAVRIEREGVELEAGGAPVPAALSGATELADGLGRLGVRAMIVQAAPSAGDVLEAARVLAGVKDDAALAATTVGWERVGAPVLSRSRAGGPPQPEVAAAAPAARQPGATPRTESAPVVSAPVAAPVSTPVGTPVSTPVSTPASTPIAPPTAAVVASGAASPPAVSTSAAALDDDVPLIARPGAPVAAADLPALAPVAPRPTPSSMPVQAAVDAFATPTAIAALAALDAAAGDAAIDRALELAADAVGRAARDEDAATVVAIWRGVQRRESSARGVGARAAYLGALERLKRPTVLRAVAGALVDPTLAADAALVLARADTDGAAALVDLLSTVTATDARRPFVEVLGRLSAAVPALVRMLRDARWHVARDAATLLGELRAVVAEGPLADLLTHEDDRVRRAACAALARLGTPEAIRALRGALGDVSPAVRAVAAACLAEREGAASADTLASALDDEDDVEVQHAILAALGTLGTPEAVQRLIRAAEPDRRLFRKKPLALRLAAVRALAEANSSAAIAALQALANDKEREVREAAVVAARDRAARARALRGRPTPAGA